MGYNRKTFAVAVLQQLGYQPTPENVRAMVGWSRAEGGNWNNSARYNPLNTTQPMPGAGNTGTQGNIKVYRSWDQGIRATVKTLRNGNYGGILGALKHGQDAGAVARAIANSPWGTSASLIESVIGSTPRINVRGIRVPQQHHAGSVTVRTSSPGSTSNGLSVPAPDMSGLSSLLAQQQTPQLPYASPLAAPSFSAQKYVPGGGGITSYGPQQPQQTGGSLADALASIGQSVDPTLSGIKYPGTSNTVTVKGAKGASHGTGPLVSNGKFPVRRIDGLKLAVPKAAWNPYNKPMAPWLADALSWARQHGWQGSVSSGYRTAAEQTAAAGHYGLQHYPNGAQASNHRTGNAVDVDPTHARQLANILRRYPGKKPIWGGPVMGDWVHFSNNGH